MTRILIVDDHPIVRDALASMLAERRNLQVVAVAANLREAVSLLGQCSPDLVIADLSLEDGNAVELVREARRQRLNSRILIMTAFREEFWAAEALAAGADGYLLKEQPTADLMAAIDIVARGETYVSPAIAKRLRSDTPAHDGDRLNRLSQRERQVFHLVVTGKSSRDIAGKLLVSIKTVETHRTNINRKLGVRNTAGLIRYAVGHGIEVAPEATSTPAGGDKQQRAAVAQPSATLVHDGE